MKADPTPPGPLTDAQLAGVVDALYAGRKIQAIKRYRDATNIGLKEAKDEVEAIEAALRAKSPERFTASTGGCLTMVLIAAVPIVAALARWAWSWSLERRGS